MLKKIEGLKLPEIEKKVLDFWKTDDTFQKSLKQTQKGKPFVFFEGPPGANGLPGIHHMLSRAFKDIVLRYKKCAVSIYRNTIPPLGGIVFLYA